MSLNKYIRSKTVRDYYESIDYEISPIVALWAILNGTYQYVDDMHRELRDLKHNTDDISVEVLVSDMTLHSMINHYIDLYNTIFQTFKISGDGVTYRIYDRALFDDFDDGFLESYHSYEECMRQIHIRTGNVKKAGLKTIPKWDAKEFVIRKSSVDKYDNMLLHITYQGKIIELYDGEEYSEIRTFLNHLERRNYDFPLPFEYGDIVRAVRAKGWLNNMVYEGRQKGFLDGISPSVSCTVVTKEKDIFTYCAVNPFELEKCDPRERDIFPLTHLISSFETHNINICEFLERYEEYRK